jgi:Zn-dependent peptidase ImmA (M78 family)/DNA-binding XRE family transcriptional regulator
MNDEIKIPNKTSDASLMRGIGSRLRAAREELALTQEQVSTKLGLKDRQILSNIESGKRKVSADELMRFMTILRKPLEFFTDPFMLIGEGSFSWRARADIPTLQDFESLAGKWIALYRHLKELNGESSPLFVSQLPLSTKSSYEDAQECAEKLSVEWNLGDVPARTLHSAIEEKLNALVLFIDAPSGISGAACQLPQLNSILVNRREPEGRRSYDLAHELFHILTWDRMPPDKLDPFIEAGKTKNRVEQLAENFAGALLMPLRILKNLVSKRRADSDINSWLNETAESLEVSSRALLWRLKNLSLIEADGRFHVNEALLSWNGKESVSRELPPLFSKKYLELLRKSLENGLVSVSKVESVLGLDRDTHRGLYESHGMEVPFDL